MRLRRRTGLFFEQLEPRCLLALPDLVVTDLQVTAYSATDISYSYTIKNIGDWPAELNGPTGADFDNLSVQAMLSADEVYGNAGDLPAGGTIVGLSPLAPLQPGASLSGTFSASAAVDPLTRPFLMLMVDSGDVVTESREDNNTMAVLIDSNPEASWQELPDLNRPGVPTGDWAVGGDVFLLTRADDLQGLDGEPITDLHWWGNYELWGDDPHFGIEMRGSGIEAFRLTVRDDGDGLPGGVPGAVLWTTVVPFDSLIEMETGQRNLKGSSIYRYDCVLEEPFLQIEEKFYWLEIAAMSRDPTDPARWRWQESSLAAAPNLIPGSAESTVPPGGWSRLEDVDLAFEVTKGETNSPGDPELPNRSPV